MDGIRSNKDIKRWIYIEEVEENDEKKYFDFECFSSDNYYLYKKSGKKITNPRIIYQSTQNNKYYYVKNFTQFQRNYINYMINEERIKEVIAFQKNSLKENNYNNEFPCIEFGTVTIVKFEDICNYIEDFIGDYKKMKYIIDNLEKDKDKNEIHFFPIQSHYLNKTFYQAPILILHD